MTRRDRVRGYAARRVWTTNPHSATLAAVAVGLADLLDRDPHRPGVSRTLDLALAHLRGCRAEPDGLDEIRARMCRKLLGMFETATGP